MGESGLDAAWRAGGEGVNAAGIGASVAASSERSAVVLRGGPWRSVVDCRLCRSVAFSVFVLILAIESVILVPSALNFQRGELRRLEDRAMSTIAGALAADHAGPASQDLAYRFSRILQDGRFVALRAVRPDGTLVAEAGAAAFEGFDIGAVRRAAREVVRRRVQHGSRYDIAWAHGAGAATLVILARMDSSSVNAALSGFVLRIAGLVALIVSVVTTGTMLVVYRRVLSPVLKLRRSLLRAAAAPDHADEFRLSMHADGELGDVFWAHDEMLSRMAESRRADRRRAEERARFLSRHDALTGLPNRDCFLRHLGQSLSAAGERGEVVQVQVLNLDGFGSINDALGQHVGDRVLMEVARRLSQDLTEDRFAARLGGDEFGFTTRGVAGPAQAADQAERILSEIARPLAIDGHEIRLSGRVGIACPPVGFTDGEAVLHDAEVALGRIRRDALARYQFFSPDMTREAQKRQEIERGLRLAVERGEFRLVYQPRVVLEAAGPRGRRFASCEALIRWQHPVRGWVSPGEFVPIAESSGQIIAIGEWVLHEACTQIRRWIDAGLTPPRVAVNVSARQFRNPALPDQVRDALAAAGIDAGYLEIEITESAVMEDVALTTAVLSMLRRLGLHLSIDDFGTGYSSLSYLRRLEVDAIKIDKSFVDDIGCDANADAICDAIIRLGHSLGKRVVAEGVETAGQAEFLRLRRCQEAQGYLFAKPMSAADLGEWLAPYRSEVEPIWLSADVAPD